MAQMFQLVLPYNLLIQIKWISHLTPIQNFKARLMSFLGRSVDKNFFVIIFYIKGANDLVGHEGSSVMTSGVHWLGTMD